MSSETESLRKKVAEQAVPMLERWLRLALRDQAMEAACTIYAHLAYRYKNRRPEELDASAVATLQVSQIFLNIHHRFRLDASAAGGGGTDFDMSDANSNDDEAHERRKARAASATGWGRGWSKDRNNNRNGNGGNTRTSVDRVAWLDTGLGIPETEIFDLFQRFRHYALRWLSKHPRQCNDIMENIVQTVTLIGRDQQGQYDAQTAQALQAVKSKQVLVRGDAAEVDLARAPREHRRVAAR